MTKITAFFKALLLLPFQAAWAFLKLILILLAAGAFALWFWQERLLFPGSHLLPPLTKEAATARGAELSFVELPDGASVPCVRFGSAPRVVLAFPGNAQSALSAAESVYELLSPWRQDAPHSVVSCSWRGFEGAAGTLRGFRVVEDAKALAAQWKPSGVFGRSLGSGGAVAAAAAARVGAVLVSPWDRFSSVASDAVSAWGVPTAPVLFLFANEIDAESSAASVGASSRLSAIVLAGDALVLPERSESLFASWAGSDKRLAKTPGGHNDSPWPAFSAREGRILLGLPEPEPLPPQEAPALASPESQPPSADSFAPAQGPASKPEAEVQAPSASNASVPVPKPAAPEPRAKKEGKRSAPAETSSDISAEASAPARKENAFDARPFFDEAPAR